jgi:hypothetical protein
MATLESVAEYRVKGTTYDKTRETTSALGNRDADPLARRLWRTRGLTPGGEAERGASFSDGKDLDRTTDAIYRSDGY